MPVNAALLVSSALFAAGIYGILTRRNTIAILLSIELILNAASLNFVLFGRIYGSAAAHSFAIFIIALAACEAAIGLAIVIALFRTARTVDAGAVNLLNG